MAYYGGWSNRVRWPFQNADQDDDSTELVTSLSEESNPDKDSERVRYLQSLLKKPTRPPSSWMEALATLADALKFAYAETLGKWPLHDLAFGINYLLRRQVMCAFKTLEVVVLWHLTSHPSF